MGRDFPPTNFAEEFKLCPRCGRSLVWSKDGKCYNPRCPVGKGNRKRRKEERKGK